MDHSEIPVFAELAVLYSEPGRFYHGWTHLLDCLVQLDLAAELMDDPDAVEMALWFHDAVYKPGAMDNEYKSAELFTLLAGEYFSPTFFNKIYEYILLTRHQDAPKDLDGCFVVDIDLSSFAASWDKFIQDSCNIRSENDYLADDEFYPKQIGFLQSLLDRQRIFFSDHFFTHYEGIARQNIMRFLAELRSRATVV